MTTAAVLIVTHILSFCLGAGIVFLIVAAVGYTPRHPKHDNPGHLLKPEVEGDEE